MFSGLLLLADIYTGTFSTHYFIEFELIPTSILEFNKFNMLLFDFCIYFYAVNLKKVICFKMTYINTKICFVISIEKSLSLQDTKMS